MRAVLHTRLHRMCTPQIYNIPRNFCHTKCARTAIEAYDDLVIRKYCILMLTLPSGNLLVWKKPLATVRFNAGSNDRPSTKKRYGKIDSAYAWKCFRHYQWMNQERH